MILIVISIRTFHIQLGRYLVLAKSILCNASVQRSIAGFQIEDPENRLVVFDWNIDSNIRQAARREARLVLVPLVAQSAEVAGANGAGDGRIGVLGYV